MHDDERNPAALGFAAVTLVAVAVAGSALKAIQAWLHQLDKTFQIFTTTAANGMVVAGYLLATVSIAAAIVAVIYVTYKYVVLVKQATEIQTWAKKTLRDFKVDFRGEFVNRLDEIERDFSFRVQLLREDMEEKIKPPEPKPETVPKLKADSLPDQPKESEETEDMNDEMSDYEPSPSQPF